MSKKFAQNLENHLDQNVKIKSYMGVLHWLEKYRNDIKKEEYSNAPPVPGRIIPTKKNLYDEFSSWIDQNNLNYEYIYYLLEVIKGIEMYTGRFYNDIRNVYDDSIQNSSYSERITDRSAENFFFILEFLKERYPDFYKQYTEENNTNTVTKDDLKKAYVVSVAIGEVSQHSHPEFQEQSIIDRDKHDGYASSKSPHASDFKPDVFHKSKLYRAVKKLKTDELLVMIKPDQSYSTGTIASTTLSLKIAEEWIYRGRTQNSAIFYIDNSEMYGTYVGDVSATGGESEVILSGNFYVKGFELTVEYYIPGKGDSTMTFTNYATAVRFVLGLEVDGIRANLFAKIYVKFNPRIAKEKEKDPDYCEKDEYYGIGGAGIVYICKADKTVFLQKRSGSVTGGTGMWSSIGGGILPKDVGKVGDDYQKTPIPKELRLDPKYQDEMFLAHAKKEVQEEIGFLPDGAVRASHAYEDCGFVYKVFVMEVAEAEKEKFTNLKTNWESSGHKWFDLTEFVANAKKRKIFLDTKVVVEINRLLS